LGKDQGRTLALFENLGKTRDFRDLMKGKGGPLPSLRIWENEGFQGSDEG
jgi:hypothetical protein